MSYRDKRQLMRDIALLDADHVPELLRIIFRQMPDSFTTVFSSLFDLCGLNCPQKLAEQRPMMAQSIDVDVSFLSPATLSRVEDYVSAILGVCLHHFSHGNCQSHLDFIKMIVRRCIVWQESDIAESAVSIIGNNEDASRHRCQLH